MRDLLRLVIIVDHHKAVQTKCKEHAQREEVGAEEEVFHGRN